MCSLRCCAGRTERCATCAGPTICRIYGPAGEAPRPDWLPRQRAGTTPQMIGRFPDYDVLASAGDWDDATRAVVLARLEPAHELSFFAAGAGAHAPAFCDVVLAQDAEPRVPVAELIDEKLAAGRLDGYQYADMPDDRETWRLTLAGLDHTAAEWHGQATFAGMRGRGSQGDHRRPLPRAGLPVALGRLSTSRVPFRCARE